MGESFQNPIILSQNRLQVLLGSREARVKLYRAVLERRLAEAAAGDTRLRIPKPLGIRRRLPGKPYHGDPEFFFQESGSLHFDFAEERLVLRPGECGLVPAGLPHGERWTGRFLNVIYMTQPDGFSLHIGYLLEGMRCGPADRFPGIPEVINGYAAQLAASGEDTVGRRLRQGLYLALLSRLWDGVEGDIPVAEVERPLLRQCEDWLDAHSSRLDFSVEWLAKNLGCSPDHLSRVYRRRHGRRLIEALHDRRIAKARELLRTRTMGVAEVAWACGYARPSYFNRMFRRREGCTPREFVVAKVGADPRP